MKIVELYSDGSCISNPGPGGWACILKCTMENGEYEKEFYGSEDNTTNNRMELTGVIVGLQQLKYKCKVIITTDSQYVVNAFNKGWIYNWEKQKFAGRPNSDLWEKLLALVKQHEVEFVWIRGHAGHAYNERCDKLANYSARKLI